MSPEILLRLIASLRMWQDAERSGRYALNIDPYDVIGMRASAAGVLSNGSGDINEGRKACWRPFRQRTILSRRILLSAIVAGRYW